MEFALKRSENIVIWLRWLSREEARPALAWKPGGTFTAGIPFPPTMMLKVCPLEKLKDWVI